MSGQPTPGTVVRSNMNADAPVDLSQPQFPHQVIKQSQSFDRIQELAPI